MRKKDPGEKFPWHTLSKNGLGKWYSEKKIKTGLNKSNISKNIFFKNLNLIGYRYFNKKIRLSRDKKIIIAFQSKFLPQNTSGLIDQKTYIISHLLAG